MNTLLYDIFHYSKTYCGHEVWGERYIELDIFLPNNFSNSNAPHSLKLCPSLTSAVPQSSLLHLDTGWCGRVFLWCLDGVNHSSRHVGLWLAQCHHWALGPEWQKYPCDFCQICYLWFSGLQVPLRCGTRAGALCPSLKVLPLLWEHELSNSV